MTTPIKVEQADRDAAADLAMLVNRTISEAHNIRKGRADHDVLVQTCAGIRIAAEAKTREEDARIARSYEQGIGPATGWTDEFKSGFEVGIADASVAIEAAIRSRIPETPHAE